MAVGPHREQNYEECGGCLRTFLKASQLEKLVLHGLATFGDDAYPEGHSPQTSKAIRPSLRQPQFCVCGALTAAIPKKPNGELSIPSHQRIEEKLLPENQCPQEQAP